MILLIQTCKIFPTSNKKKKKIVGIHQRGLGLTRTAIKIYKPVFVTVRFNLFRHIVNFYHIGRNSSKMHTLLLKKETQTLPKI